MDSARANTGDLRALLARALRVPSAFPWQLALLDRMLTGALPGAVDVPTGLGKTGVIAAWLVARAAGAPVPRRLVYVVDRRAVVDQATEVAEELRRFVEEEPALKPALKLGRQRRLPISTLRGQFIDNREWLVDPSTPAIVLGTVDMVGSRLLFEGYGVSRRMRPYHAGLLGADSLVVIDEAHLVPPFEHLLRTIARAPAAGLGPEAPHLAELVPPLRLLSLSATGRADSAALALGDADRAHPVVARRLAAKKQVVLRPPAETRELAERLADEAWALTDAGAKPIRCVVFCTRRSDAQTVAEKLVGRASKHAPPDVELFVGGRRVWERTTAADWLRARGFLAGARSALERPAFVIATAAGEVGVDLDADHMVSDLVAWERMVQRLGRVNRRGDGAATVIVIPAGDEDDEARARLAAVRALLEELPRTEDGGLDASPGAIVALKARAADDAALRDLLARASTPEPLRPALTRPLLEAWSMTSLVTHTGRPEVAPWLRGWISEEDPRTTLAWREILPISRAGELLSRADLDTFLIVAGPQLAEQLEIETWLVMEWLTARAAVLAASSEARSAGVPAPAEERAPDAEAAPSAAPSGPVLARDEIIGVIISSEQEPWPVSLSELLSKEARARIEERLAGSTVLLDVRIGGLDRGLLKEDSDAASDVTGLAGQGEAPVAVRVRRVSEAEAAASDAPAAEASWREEARIAVHHSSTGDELEWLVIESLATSPAESEDGRSVAASREQKLQEHEEWAGEAAREIAERLALPQPYAELLILAAQLHDEGKRARRWQRAFRAPGDGVYGKTRSRPNLQLLAGYRHELGSLPCAERDARVQALDADRRDLCLHLIAAHHGNARPLLRTDGAEEPPSKLEARAQEIALRFTRLERRWGPWGLAWWESLLRAADQQASRWNDEGRADG